MKKSFYYLLMFFCVTSNAQSIIGTTTYDLQTNSGAKNRIVAYPGGLISAIWTGSQDFAGTFPDRGMFYNFNDGSDWGSYPDNRIETTRSGFGEIVNVNDHEVVFSHELIDTTLIINRNVSIGDMSWSETSGSRDINGLWPSVFCPQGTDDLYVISANAFLITSINFSRSDDGGETWTILDSPLPYLSVGDGFTTLSAEKYQIAVNGIDVYVLYGSPWTDLILLHSNMNGEPGSWELTTIIDFPIDNYNGALGQISDYTGDGIADTIKTTTDGYLEMLVSEDGVVHVWTGNYWLYDNNPDATGWSYWPSISGMRYWNSETGLISLIPLFFDWDNADGLNDPYVGIGNDFSVYSALGLTSMAGAAIDESSGRIYLVYTMPLEYTDLFDDPENELAQSFRDLFGIYTDDNGISWSLPVNLSNSAEFQEENIYPSVYEKVVDGKVHVIWQQDIYPGNIQEIPADPIVMNNIRYAGFTEEDFESNYPVADFSYSIVYDIGTAFVTFTNLSTDALTYYWDFDDGTETYEENPMHTFTIGSDYNVCLYAYNLFDDDFICQTIPIYNLPIADFSFSGDPIVAFTDLSSNVPTEWLWNFDDGAISILPNPSHEFELNGIYNVCLTSSNFIGSDTKCESIIIDSYLPPVVNFNFTGDPLVSFIDMSLNSPLTWEWDFGDGSYSTDQNPIHDYLTNGIFEVCLFVTNAGGSGESCQFVDIEGNLPPLTSFTYVGDPAVDFTDLSLNDPTDWYWEFGDGTTSIEQNPSHIYNTNGSFNVCLTATNDLGSETSCSTIVISTYLLTEALFTFIGDPIVEFTDNSTNAPFLWAWDFGDGSVSSIQHPIHEYAENGDYNVCLEVSNAGGSDIQCETITISQNISAPIADFIYTPLGLSVSFTDVSLNLPNSWSWDFGDGQISNLQNPVCDYESAGEYTVCLISANGAGIDSECKIILTTSIQENNINELIYITPNPAIDFLKITILNKNGPSQIVIQSLTGSTVLRKDIEFYEGVATMQIKGLTPGTYLVNVIDGFEFYSEKIIIF